MNYQILLIVSGFIIITLLLCLFSPNIVYKLHNHHFKWSNNYKILDKNSIEYKKVMYQYYLNISKMNNIKPIEFEIFSLEYFGNIINEELLKILKKSNK